jgi:uncharacterized repeat protein (TIGR01451 family)
MPYPTVRPVYAALLTAVLTSISFHSASAQVAPTLGAAQSFAVLAAQTVTNTGPTIVSGDLGTDPGTAVTGFPPGSVSGGAILGPGGAAGLAQLDTTAAYIGLASQICPVSNTFGVPTDLGGLTLVPGVYCFASSAGLTGTLTLDALGNPNAVWVFQVASTLITEVGSRVVIINGGQQCNVFWQVGSSATLKTGTTFVGNILALTSIALNTNANVAGRVLARNGAVTMDSNTVGSNACAAPPLTPLPPTLAKAFSPNAIIEGGTSTLTVTLSNPDATTATSASLTDTLPTGVTTADSATTTCGGTVTTGTSSVTLTGGSIPANGSCTVTVLVTSAGAGGYINSLASGALQTSNGSNATKAVATLTVLLPTATPGLSLNKTADRTTYTSVGQAIVYTYVVRNTGGVTLTGPFTVTDDKLGAFVCGSAATTLAPGAAVTCTKSYKIRARDLSYVTGSLTGVVATIDTGSWLLGVASTQDTSVTDAGSSVVNGVYPAWCIQDHVPADLHNRAATLYSTVGGSLPADVASLAWNKVNYALNHKIREAGKSRLAFLKDVQTAIWVLLGEQNPEFGVSAAAQQMINEANAQPGYVPSPYDVVAVLVYSDGMTVTADSIQESIIEMQPLSLIVNHATASGASGGAVVRSGQAQATVRQVR